MAFAQIIPTAPAVQAAVKEADASAGPFAKAGYPSVTLTHRAPIRSFRSTSRIPTPHGPKQWPTPTSRCFRGTQGPDQPTLSQTRSAARSGPVPIFAVFAQDSPKPAHRFGSGFGPRSWRCLSARVPRQSAKGLAGCRRCHRPHGAWRRALRHARRAPSRRELSDVRSRRAYRTVRTNLAFVTKQVRPINHHHQRFIVRGQDVTSSQFGRRCCSCGSARDPHGR